MLSPSNIGFSQGFPDQWHLTYTDIKVPSEHMQDGKRYDAEVVLSHEDSHKEKKDKYGSVPTLPQGVSSLIPSHTTCD
jgi:hypothetical protein